MYTEPAHEDKNQQLPYEGSNENKLTVLDKSNNKYDDYMETYAKYDRNLVCSHHQ